MAIWLTRLGSFIDRNGWDMYYAYSTIILIDGRYLLMYNRGEGKLRAAKREISPWIHWLLVLAMITDLDYVVGVWEITVITEQKGWVTWLISGNTGTDPVAFYLSLDLEFQYSFMRTFSFYSFEPHFQNCIFLLLLIQQLFRLLCYSFCQAYVVWEFELTYIDVRLYIDYDWLIMLS